MPSRPHIVAVILAAALAALAARPAGACTSFCMDTPDGPVFGFNLDLFVPGDGLVFVNRRGLAKQGYAAGTTGEVARWSAVYGSVTFNVAGRELPCTGMNEAGLVISGMELRAGSYPEPDARPPLGNANWVQYLLDTCGTVEEAAARAQGVRLEDTTPTNHFLVADATGNAAAFEWLDGRLAIYTGDALPAKAMANLRHERAMEALARGGPRWWWSNPGQSAERVAACADRMAGFDAARDTNAVDHAFATLVFAVRAPHTRWHVVYDIGHREVWWATVVSREVKHLALASCDFACGEPPLMLDVDAPVAGNAADAFAPYDPAANRAMFASACARFAIAITPEAAASLMDLFEGFDCAP